MSTTRRTIRVENLARVEGEGALDVRIREGRVEEVKLRIYEPPRFFEAFLRGRAHSEAPDITARICGICPVAYQMSAVQAIEQAIGVTVSKEVRALRRLLYCGEWIESHALHIYLLHAPDFLGYESAIHMAKDHPEAVQRGLRLKKIGNDLVRAVGGREIHPINVRVGGFHRSPAPAELRALEESLRWARDAAIETARWTNTFEFPALSRDVEYVALRHPSEYAMNEGRIVSSRGLDVAAEEFLEHIEERHVPHSTALHANLKEGGAYAVGPLARLLLNADRLPSHVQSFVDELGLREERNPFRSIVVRAVETLYACEEALRLIAAYEPPEKSEPVVPQKHGIGHACTEAPRGILYHRYDVDRHGMIADARIVPPTSQNQRTIEEDLHECVAQNLSLANDELQMLCERAIRNYDPCISCSTHFLRLTVDRR